MWRKSYSKVYSGVTKEDIWNVWIDVRAWPDWDNGLEEAYIEGPFSGGTIIMLKPKRIHKIQIEITEVSYLDSFTVCFHFWGARLWWLHTMQETDKGLILMSTLTVKGWLSYVWVLLVAKGIFKMIPEQTDNLVNYVLQRTESHKNDDAA